MTVRLDTSPVPCVKKFYTDLIDVHERHKRLVTGGNF